MEIFRENLKLSKSKRITKTSYLVSYLFKNTLKQNFYNQQNKTKHTELGHFSKEVLLKKWNSLLK